MKIIFVFCSPIGLNSIEATLEDRAEAGQFGEDNSNCKLIGQGISCWGGG
ncbi:MAG: hypothetical protein IT254_04580 [Chitinophagaceae bacterium]|nr:hypothetical protein [Bacteroidota bacterium]MCC6257575.1 hypothetical protein [Chitinophagaceae bacterium]MCW5916696.1 hypothetical protein [Ferruginibacter sp.]